MWNPDETHRHDVIRDRAEAVVNTYATWQGEDVQEVITSLGTFLSSVTTGQVN